MAKNFFTQIIGSRNDRQLRQYRKRAAHITAMEPDFEALSDAELRAKTDEFRQRLADGAKLNALLPEAFATVREAAKRVLKMRHYDVQLVGGMALHEGNIAEMRTGEGKTLVATLPIYLNALTGRGVHLVTVNDYLAGRDAAWMGQVYRFLGLTVGVNAANMSKEAKQEAYSADITYGTNNEFGFDYLRDNMVYELDQRVQRPLHYAIVDEVDSILIDEARTPLIISGQAEDRTAMYVALNDVVPLLKRQEGEEDPRTGEGVITPGDFYADEKTKQVYLTESGHEKAERILSERGLITEGGSLYDTANIALMHHLNAALRAHYLYHKDEHYVVQPGQNGPEVVIVDDFTGRLMEGRRWSEGLHQAVEAKEHVSIQAENQTLASITFQNYFRLYEKLAGMTGTAETEAAEFEEIYHLETVVIPPNRPNQRDDQLDRVYRSTDEKYKAAITDIADCYARGQPVLVGTSSIENSEVISALLKRAKLPHRVLNAKQHDSEAEIVAQAGSPRTITIATNMAGRGTDIVLGGNVEAEIKALEQDEALDEAARAAAVEKLQADWQQRHEQVKSLGGLRVVATERNESRRIDNQLRGRSGRQGDPGSSRFYLSLDDQLMRIFAGDRVRAIMDRLKMPEGEAIEARMVTRSIENAQRKVEARNFDIRKQLLDYDDIANEQRKVIYEQRDHILSATDLGEQIAAFREGCMTDLARGYVPLESVEEQWDLPGLQKVLAQDWHLDVPLVRELEASHDTSDEDIAERVVQAANTEYQRRLELVGAENFRPFERAVLLQTLDLRWREHLSALDFLRKSIHLRSYAQKQPKQEYAREAFDMFGRMLDVVRDEVTRTLLTVRIQTTEEAEQAVGDVEHQREQMANVTYTSPSETGEPQTVTEHGAVGGRRTAAAAAASAATGSGTTIPRVGRNDPCPCGSGKKYKHCHGALH